VRKPGGRVLGREGRVSRGVDSMSGWIAVCVVVDILLYLERFGEKSSSDENGTDALVRSGRPRCYT
jgi:hypothetical protein